MPKGDLQLEITEMAGDPVRGRIEIDLQPASGESGTGGEHLELTVNMGTATGLTITGIACRGGHGTMYRLTVMAGHYRTYSFFQSIREQRVNTGSDQIEFWVKPGEVRKLSAPKFEELRPPVRRLIDTAQMAGLKPEDQDLAGLTGQALYQKLGALRNASLLNLVKKSSHAETAANCLALVRSLILCRQDRCFALVDGGMPEHLRRSPLYKSAKNALHDPLPGYRLAEGSFKTLDPHGNLQVTFMQNASTGQLAADIDIDEASGISHGFEVIRNALFEKRTNPYLIREFLLAADRRKRTLDPGYRFLF